MARRCQKNKLGNQSFCGNWLLLPHLFFFSALDDRADFMMVCVFCNGVIRHRGQRCVNALNGLIILLERRHESQKTYPETRLDVKSVQANRLF